MEKLQMSSVLDGKKAGKKSRELWLFRVPADLDVKSLDGRNLPMVAGEIEISAEEGKLVLQVSSQEAASNEASQMLPLIPNEELDQLSITKSFSRLVKICKSAAVPTPMEVKEAGPPKQPAKLAGRVVPSGSGLKGIGIGPRPSPMAAAGDAVGKKDKKGKKEKKEKKAKEEPQAAEVEEVKVEPKEDLGSAKKEKKKRKKETDAEPDDEVGTDADQKKQKKKKRRSEDQESGRSDLQEAETAETDSKKSKRKKGTTDAEPAAEGDADTEVDAEAEKKTKKKKKKDKDKDE